MAVDCKQLGRAPGSVDLQTAAAVPLAAQTALQGLRDSGDLQAGHKVLINGASGGVGVFAVQIAKILGAEVTGVASGENLSYVRALGAEETVDYQTEDVSRRDTMFDVIFDTVGAMDFRSAKRILAPNGLFLPLNFGLGDVPRAMWSGLGRGPRGRSPRFFRLACIPEGPKPRSGPQAKIFGRNGCLDRLERGCPMGRPSLGRSGGRV